MGTPTKNTRKTRSRLGRGLSALVDQAPTGPVQVNAESVTIQNTNKQAGLLDPVEMQGVGGHRVIEIDVTHVEPNPHQPRRDFDEVSLEELANSIAEHGLMQPIVVRSVLGEHGHRYELIAGERRWRASRQAGRTRVPAIVLEVDDAHSAQLALIENIQREDLNPIERANGFATLASGFSMTQEQIASKVGISRSSVANMLRLLELDEEIRSMIASGSLSAGHAKALLSCPDQDRRQILAGQCAQQGWSVRQLEQTVSESNQGQHPSREVEPREHDSRHIRLESVLHDLENRLGEQLGTKVTLKTDRSGTKGSITIEFYDLDHFDGLMNRLGVESAQELGGS